MFNVVHVSESIIINCNDNKTAQSSQITQAQNNSNITTVLLTAEYWLGKHDVKALSWKCIHQLT